LAEGLPDLEFDAGLLAAVKNPADSNTDTAASLANAMSHFLRVKGLIAGG
jgi:hypothetical protein